MIDTDLIRQRLAVEIERAIHGDVDSRALWNAFEQADSRLACYGRMIAMTRLGEGDLGGGGLPMDRQPEEVSESTQEPDSAKPTKA